MSGGLDLILMPGLGFTRVGFVCTEECISVSDFGLLLPSRKGIALAEER